MNRALLALVILMEVACTPATPAIQAPAQKPVYQPKLETIPEPVTFKLIAGVVRKNGEVVHIPRNGFTLRTCNLTALIDDVRRKLESRHEVPPPPPKDSPYTVCLECQIACDTYNGYDKCTRKCGDCEGKTIKAKEAEYKAAVTAWQEVAWAGLKDEIAKATPKDLVSEYITTDLNGEATVSLRPGTWYVFGSASVSGSLVIWDDTQIDVKPGMTKFELSNDNATRIL